MFITALIVCLFEVAQAYIGTGVIAASSCTTCQMSVGGGGWSQWSEWSRCGMTLGVMSQSRYRACSMPRCTGGVVSEARPCIVYIQRPAPQWSEWGPWSACSASCGGGVSQRTRVCVDPCTNCCLGTATESQACNTQPCCEWSPWSPWSECSVTCGTGGVTYRTRQCSCAEGCPGSSSEQMPCDAPIPCPVPTTPAPPPPPPPPPVQPPVAPPQQPSPPICLTTCYIPMPTCVTCTAYTTWTMLCCKPYGRRFKRYSNRIE